MSGVTTAPTSTPALKMPVAKARSLFGNHCATAVSPAGYAPPSPNPRRMRARHEAAETARETVRDLRDRPDRESDGETHLRAEAIDKTAEKEIARRIGALKRRDDVGVVGLAPAEIVRQERLQDRDHLAIEVVERHRQEQQKDDGPSGPILRRLRRGLVRQCARVFEHRRLADIGEDDTRNLIAESRDGTAVNVMQMRREARAIMNVRRRT